MPSSAVEDKSWCCRDVPTTVGVGTCDDAILVTVEIGVDVPI